MKNFSPDFVVLSDKGAQGAIQSAVPTQSRTTIWTENQANDYITTLSKVVVNKDIIVVTVAVDKKFEDVLNSKVFEEVFMSIHLPDNLLYFRTRVTNVSTAIFNFRVLNPVYKLERRKSQRCPVRQDMASKIRGVAERIPLEQISATLFNLTPDGAGILVKDFSLETRLVLGERITLHFNLGTLAVVASGILKSRSILLSRKLGRCLRFGVQFDQIEEVTKKEIQKFIASQNLKKLV